MNDGSATPDFGAGLSLDEMVGMMAWEISQAVLPTGKVYQAVSQAAGYMVEGGLEAYMLMEVWADGHTRWHGMRRDDPVIVTLAGELIRTR